MLRHGRARLGILLGAALGACRSAPPAPPAAPTPATVVLVSLDGFRADYLDRRLPLPAFARLEAAGVRARALVPSFPSKTFPNHWTLVTGLRPGRHGIVANAFWDPVTRREYRIRDTAAVRDASWYGGVPLWALAERAGIRTGTVFWPGSEAPVGGVRPSRWLRYDGAMPDSARVDTVVAWLALPAAERPRFVALYVSVADDSGHAAGPDAPATDSAVVEADRTLGRLLDRLDAMPGGNAVDVVVVSDHGMDAVAPERTVDLSRCDRRDAFADARTGDAGPVLSMWFDEPGGGVAGGDAAGTDAASRAANAEAVLRSCLAPAAAGAPFNPLAHARVYARAETPARWALRAQPRAGDLLIVADSGWTVVPAPPARPLHGGGHGWDPAADRAMRAIFLAAGPHVRARGEIAAVENVHVAPFLGALLGVAWPAGATDGDVRVLAPLLDVRRLRARRGGTRGRAVPTAGPS